MTGERREEVRVTTAPEYERREQVVENRADTARVILSRVAAFIYLMFGILIALIGFRIILSLIDANAASGFGAFIYGVTNPFLAPFFGLTGTPLTPNGGTLEIPSIIAMFVYALLAWVIVYLLRILFAPPRSSRSRRVSTVRREY